MNTHGRAITLTLVSAVAVASFVAGGPAAVAARAEEDAQAEEEATEAKGAGQATITLAKPELVEYKTTDEEGNEFSDEDGRADDLIIGFTESGIGNGKGAIVELSVTRTVTVTCVSAVSQFSTSESEVHKWFDGDDPSDSTTFSETSDQKPGRWLLEGRFIVRTRFAEVCQRSDAGAAGETYFVKDYSVTYTDVSVKDSENGVEASDPGPYSFQAPPSGGFTTPEAELWGLSCTVEDLETAQCQSN